LFTKDGTKIIEYPKGKTNTHYTIPDGVTTIDNGVFSNNDVLKSITFPNSVTYIGRWAFQDCDGLTKITLLDGIESIGYEAFYGCSNLTSITIPKSIAYIGKNIVDSACVYFSGTRMDWFRVETNEMSSYSDVHCLDSISRDDITLTYSDAVTYTGSEIAAPITIFECFIDEIYIVGGCPPCNTMIIDKLELGKDYTISYSDNVNVGTVTATIIGIGHYCDTRTITYNIVPKSISDITISPIEKQVYTGSAISPEITISYLDMPLTNGKDYTIVYNNNTEIGTATVTITGKGNFSGEITKTFVIDYADPVEAFVNRLYKIILGRDAESAGLADWTNRLTSGTATSAEIVYGIANSQEFANRGLSNEEIVETMYQAMLGRASDEGGKANWINCLNSGMTVTGIINGFSGSQEFANICAEYGIQAGAIITCEARDRNNGLTLFVSRMYTKALNRPYDIAGLNDWTNRYLTGEAKVSDIAFGFIFSPEFVGKGLSDSDYVDTLYRTFFNREPDEGGKADWMNKLADGMAREDVLNGFVGSQECINLVATFGI